MEVNKEVPLILGRPFLCTGRAILDIHEGQLMLRVGTEKVVFQMKRMMKYPSDEVFSYSCFRLDVIGELAEKYKFDKLVGDTLERCITESSTVDDEDPEIKKEDEALETEDQVVDEEELKKEASKPNVELKVELLSKHKKANGWSIADIQGISPAICMHKILLEENSKPVVQPQCKLNKKLEEVVHKEIIKLLDAGIIFPISDSQWTSPVQVATIRYLLPQKMLRRPHSLAYQCLEVFVDYFTLFGDDFEDCLMNLKLVLEHCEATHLVLNWEKCHFMVKEGIVLGHKVTAHGIEVDKAKVDVIARLPPPTLEVYKNNSSITKPLTQLLAKDAKFIFNVGCLRAFELIKEKLVSAPIMVTPEWSQPFEIMYDASDVAMGAVLGQQRNKMFRPIYYVSGTLNDALVNYASTEKEFFAVVFAFDKFRSYLVGSKEIKDRKGIENQVTDLLSRLEKPPVEIVEIREEFPDEQIVSIAAVSERPPWYADVANFLASGWLPRDLTHDQRRKLQDGVIRRCVPEGEMASILSHCHDGAAGGHYDGNHTAAKVMEASFFWPTLYKDARAYVAACDKCQRVGNISKRDEMSLNSILEQFRATMRLGSIFELIWSVEGQVKAYGLGTMANWKIHSKESGKWFRIKMLNSQATPVHMDNDFNHHDENDNIAPGNDVPPVGLDGVPAVDPINASSHVAINANLVIDLESSFRRDVRSPAQSTHRGKEGGIKLRVIFEMLQAQQAAIAQLQN
uniref:Uncharacterized protein n=1 Tax=Nicotiana tabacum TaxID=4097 RepID=A0A1S4DP92_TOBAC|nr:PREDICTED: uncharacterized protein LOC107831949 [Nicotiana tabacum]